VGSLGESVGDFALAVDIGGSKIAYALIDVHGKSLGTIGKCPVPFDQDGVADPKRLIATMRRYVDQARRIHGTFHGIGVGLCANVDMNSGTVILSPNLHWHGVAFGPMVEREFRVPVHAAMDCRLAAIGEAIWGAARGLKHFAWVTVGTGYGGSFFFDGKPYEGAHAFAGNFGHVTWDEVNGYPCGCGRKGCVETLVSGPAIARAGEAAARTGSSPKLRELAGDKPVTCEMVFQAERAGDPTATQIISDVIRLLAISVAGLVNTLDLQMIVLGGGVVHGCPEFVERLDRRVRTYLMTDEARRELQVVKETFPNATLFGAAANIFLEQGLLTLSSPWTRMTVKSTI
jgi:glucokinase